MIINRTQIDVDNAKKTIDDFVKKFKPLTDSQVTTLERGTMTVNTLNRIENKQTELKNLLNDMGYWNTQIVNREWTAGDIFTKDDFQRIIDNENTLRDAFFSYASTPATPSVSFHYSDINNLEKVLFDIDVMINDVKSNYRECGEFECEGD